jgi:hypothetical protein
MNTKLFRSVASLLSIIAIAFLAPIKATAQDDTPMFFQVRAVQVKLGMSGEFADLQKEFAAALTAADRPGRLVYQEVRGDIGVYYIVSPPASISSYDTPFEPPMKADDWASWLARFQDTVDSSTLTILRRYPDLGISSDDDSTPNFAYLRYRTVTPGKSSEYEEWTRSQLVPHLKMGGVKSRTQSRMVMGGNNNTWVSATFHENWTELASAGPLDHMGADARNAMLKAGDSLLVESENKILRFRADLSN